MSTSYTQTASESFTLTHARHISAKVAADLLRYQRFYGEPLTLVIDIYEAELVALLQHDYVKAVVYGFQRNGNWVEASRYHVTNDGSLVADDDPGKLRPGVDVSNASFTSFLTYSPRWFALSALERQRFKEKLPIQRSSGLEPGVENGYWVDDRTYAAGGRALARSSVRRF